MKFSVAHLRRSGFLMTLVVMVGLGIGISSCGDDPVAPQPTGSSKVTVMHANAGITSDVIFKHDTTTLSRITYGAFGSAQVNNGNRRIDVRAIDGSVLGFTDVVLDTTTSTWVFFSGTLTQKDAYKVTTKKLTNVSAGNAAVRVVNASHNAGDIILKLNSLNGSAFTTGNLAYKNGSTYIEIPITTTQLVAVKPDNTTQLTTIALTGVLATGKHYTVVIYGSTDPNADPSVALTSKVVAE